MSDNLALDEAMEQLRDLREQRVEAKRSRAIAIAKDDPDLTLLVIAKRLSVSPDLVSSWLEQAGIRQRPVRERRRGAGDRPGRP